MRQIFEADIPELEYCYGRLAPYNPHGCLTTVMSTQHPEIGAFSVANVDFPNVQIMDMRWSIPDSIVIHESHSSETVDINFVLEGNIHGKFKGLGTELQLTGGTNNLKYTPSEKSSHSALRQDANMFVIALDKKYFCDLIGHNNRWSEITQRKMERGEDFIASDKFLTTTPQMRALIHNMRNAEQSPTSRLLMQSMTFELLAQQIAPLCDSHCDQPSSDVSVNDLEKLHFVKQYIDKHFLEDLTLTNLSREGMLNEFKLKKGFKAVFGTSVIQYARDLRMNYARTLLRDHRLTVEEVASTLGYHYPNHFSTAFKKHFGVLPSHR